MSFDSLSLQTTRWKEAIAIVVTRILVPQPELDIHQDPSLSENILISGENLRVLDALSPAFREQIDFIYLDPPYNTCSDSKSYTDSRKNGTSHSAWIDFMRPRLAVARGCLRKTGFIAISIDDHEQAYLKMLCDDMFGERNFVANIIWENTAKAYAKHVSSTHEYILVYARDIAQLPEWSAPRDEEVVRDMKEIVAEVMADRTAKEAEIQLRSYVNAVAKQDPERYNWLKNYIHISPQGRIFRTHDLTAPRRPNRVVLKNGVVLEPRPDRAWLNAETINELLDRNLIYWKGDRPYGIAFLDDARGYMPSVVSGILSRHGREELQDMFGDAPFTYPKPTALIRQFLRFTPRDAVVLDFFAGSGTTGHAVLLENACDGGTRRFILVTDNENGIFDNVTYPRLRKALLGYQNRKGDLVPPLHGNLSVYREACSNENSAAC